MKALSEIKEKFMSAYNDMANSKEQWRMQVAGTLFVDMFDTLEKTHPELAKEYACIFKGMMKYYNYVTEKEAQEIVSKFVNWDGSKGAKWKSETVKSVLDKWGEKHDCEPYYNYWSLCVTMNMIASDFGETLAKLAKDDEHFAKICYDMAVDKLTDKDRKRWIRGYFGLCEVEWE